MKASKVFPRFFSTYFFLLKINKHAQRSQHNMQKFLFDIRHNWKSFFYLFIYVNFTFFARLLLQKAFYKHRKKN